MFKDQDGEKEILLGNKQLLGIFFLLAILLGVFFTAGYMVGRSAGEKKNAESAEAKSPAADASAASTRTGETHSLTPEPASSTEEHTNPSAAGPQTSSASTSGLTKELSPEEPLGSRKTKRPAAKRAEATRDALEQEPAPPNASTALPPPPAHATYLQVAALGRSDAEAVAKVLSKKGFRAHIAPKPGTQYYRVLVGPLRDAGELNSTRDALKNKGFREVFVQHL